VQLITQLICVLRRGKGKSLGLLRENDRLAVVESKLKWLHEKEDFGEFVQT
jgi:hypothetical protein